MKKNKRYLTDIKMNSYIACSIAEGFCEGENATQEEQHDAWQWLADTGTCWKLQGWYGRNAQNLIKNGIIEKPIKTHTDYYGNIVLGTQ